MLPYIIFLYFLIEYKLRNQEFFVISFLPSNLYHLIISCISKVLNKPNRKRGEDKGIEGERIMMLFFLGQNIILVLTQPSQKLHLFSGLVPNHHPHM